MAPRRQPPAQPPSAAPVAAAPVGGIIAGTPSAAAGAAGLVAGVRAQARLARQTVKAVMAMLSAIAIRRRQMIVNRIGTAYPDGDIGEALAEEDRREVVFRKRVEQRLRAGLRLALAAKDPSARTAAIQNLLKREQRYAEQRSAASGERVLASAELQSLRHRSPRGALWVLGKRQRHTPDCIAMAGKFWPWVVLNEVHPLLHLGCGCHLYSFGDAVSKGLMTAADVIGDDEALRLAATVIQHIREEKAEARRKYGHLAEVEEAATEELLIREALLDRAAADPDLLAAAPLASDLMAASPVVIQEAEAETGAMVALFPDPKLAKELALSRGTKPEDLHVTLAFLGTAADLDFDKARAAVEKWAKTCPPLSGELSGIGHFDIGKGETVTYRSVDLPDLPAPREELVSALEKADVPPKRDHGFTAHMTIDNRLRRPEVKKRPITFGQVTLVWGGERHSFPLSGKAAPSPR